MMSAGRPLEGAATASAEPSGARLAHEAHLEPPLRAVADECLELLGQMPADDRDALEPAAASSRSSVPITGLPSIGSIGFGQRSVSGRSRRPSPAASTIASSTELGEAERANRHETAGALPRRELAPEAPLDAPQLAAGAPRRLGRRVRRAVAGRFDARRRTARGRFRLGSEQLPELGDRRAGRNVEALVGEELAQLAPEAAATRRGSRVR